MLHARLREIRKEKGLTLQQVAERVKPNGTTAQTIGRLETGMRSLTVDWIEKIADALGIDPSELFAFPAAGDVVIDGVVTGSGLVIDREEGILPLRPAMQAPVAVRMGAAMGQYREGDIVLFEELPAEKLQRATGSDCLVTDREGRRHFGKLILRGTGSPVVLAPLSPTGAVREDIAVAKIATAVALVRTLSG
ncbi:MAG: hypothetical protein Tsb008_16220 [Rhodothalassiaceae bacterium]